MKNYHRYYEISPRPIVEEIGARVTGTSPKPRRFPVVFGLRPISSQIGVRNFPEFTGSGSPSSPAATSNGIWTFPGRWNDAPSGRPLRQLLSGEMTSTFPGIPRFHGPRFSIFPAATPYG